MIGVKPASRIISPRNSNQPSFFLCKEEAAGVMANTVAPVEIGDQNEESGGLENDEGASTPRLTGDEANVQEPEEVVECQEAKTGPFPIKPKPPNWSKTTDYITTHTSLGANGASRARPMASTTNEAAASLLCQ